MKTRLIILLAVASLGLPVSGLCAGLKIPALLGGGQFPRAIPQRTPTPARETPVHTAAPTSDADYVKYTEASPPPMSLEDTMAAAKNSVKTAKGARELKLEVDRLLRGAAANVHSSAVMQAKVLEGLGKYLQSLEKLEAVEWQEEMQYSELKSRYDKALDTNAPIEEITTVVTADLSGSQVSADKIMEQLNGYKSRRDTIQQQAQPYYEVFLNADLSLGIVDRNYKVALASGDIATEAVGRKLNELQTKAVAETAASAALMAALVYYGKDLELKVKPGTRHANNPLAELGQALGRQALQAGSARAVQTLTKDLQKTRQEFQDMKAYAVQARRLLDEIHTHGPALRDRNQQIAKVLTELSGVARESLVTRAQTDQEIKKFVIARDTEAQQLVAADKISVFAE